MRAINKQSGFTLIELAVAVAVMATLFIGIFAGLVQVYKDSTYSSTQVLLDATAQTAMGLIEQDVRYSASFDSVLASNFSDPYGSNNNKVTPTAWTFAGNPASATTRALLLELTSTTTNPQASTRAFVYTAGAYPCSSEIYNPPLKYTIVYFIYNGSLYRRTITDTTTVTCNSGTEVQIQKQSCPSSQSATWPAICKANDEVVAQNIVSMAVEYYDANGTLMSLYPSDGSGLLPTADSAKVTLVIGDGKSNQITSTISLGIKKVN